VKLKMQIKVTVTRVYDAEFDNTLVASQMFKELERDPNPTTIEGRTDSGAAGSWRIRACRDAKHVSVETVPMVILP
jgi:hypothetical protein